MDKKGLNLQVPKWYALRTYPKRERIVGERLKIEGAEHLIPMSMIKRVWSDRVKALLTPLLESMVLVYCTEARLNYLLSTKGVICAVKNESGPVEIDSRSVEALVEFSRLADGAFLVDEETIDRVMVVKWEKRHRRVMMVDKGHFYLYIPELEVTLYIKKTE